jgi:hypothetical protein
MNDTQDSEVIYRKGTSRERQIGNDYKGMLYLNCSAK